MIQFRKQLKAMAALLAGVWMLSASCDGNDTPLEAPTVVVDGVAEYDVAPNATAQVKLKLQAHGGAKSVVVRKNGGFLREYPINADATQFIYTTDPMSAASAEGQTVDYSFALVNLDDASSPEVNVTLKAALYNKITIGTTELYNLAVGSEGVVPAGSHVKLIKGRNYHVPRKLTFEPGSSLSIEEGVHVYMNAEATEKVAIEVHGEARIGGTVAAPVVLTSSRTLVAEATPAAGDWGRFAIIGSGNGTNSGVVSYLRMEYPSDRGFRLINVGAATQLDHIQVYCSAQEGFTITDGDARLKYLVATDCRGGSYRLGDAYAGKMQFAIAVSTARYAELDDFTIRETAAPTIANVTALGAGEAVAGNTHGMRMRTNAAPKVYNSIVAHYPRRGLRGDDAVTITDLNGSAVFAHSFIFNVPLDPFRGLATAFAGTFDTETGASLTNPFHNNATALMGKVYTLTPIPGIGVNDFVPDDSQNSAFDPASLDNSFFSSATYVGAVRSAAEDWTKGWVKNPDGTIRN